jgi:phosphate-selective porin OprO/OprP
MPFENFFRLGAERGICTGSGAWELTARWSFVDLNDKNIRGGNINDITLGVNWFMNPYTKLVFNYIHAFLNHPTRGHSDTDIYGVMAQVDF